MSVVRTLPSTDIEAKVFGATGPIVLDFFQVSCPPCRTLEPRLQRVAARYGDRLPVYRVDVDTDMPVAERFQVKSLPTVLIMRDGKETQRLDGLITDQELVAAFGAASAMR